MRPRLAVLAALALLVTGVELSAQETPPTSPTEELRLLASEPLGADEDRAAVRVFLERQDVERTAEAYGLDLDVLKQGVSTMSDDDAQSVAERVRDIEQPVQAGGNTIVISTTTIIIVLLVLILLLVA